jgi:inosine-uridine nucleoside N-ribohydrolase
VPVLVDTDLGGDDLVAMAFLLRHPSVDVQGVTIATTGLVGCDAGVRVVAGLFEALQETPLPVACGRPEPGPGGRVFPAAWREVAEAGTGIRPADGLQDPRPAAELTAEAARQTDGLVVVALGPLTNLADVAQARPGDYARLAGVHAMAGSVDGPAIDGVAEWNAAADPEALAAVLAGPAPLTLVPEDAVPEGTPDALAGPVVGTVAATIDYPRWWDLAAAAAFVVSGAGEVETGRWVLYDTEPGRLQRAGAGPVRVHRTLDSAALDVAYLEAFDW